MRCCSPISSCVAAELALPPDTEGGVLCGRKTEYESLDRLQVHLDRYLEFAPGLSDKGRTPYRTFIDKVANMQEKEVAGPAVA